MTTLSHPAFKKDIHLIERWLLLCGPLASLLYVAATVLGAMVWKGYSSFSQEVSELFAVDAPSRSLVIALFLVYSALMIAFAVGVWRSAARSRALRVVAVLMVVDQVRGITGTIFAPMHLRGVQGSSTDIWHIILTIATVLLILLILGGGAAAFGKRFRLYSIATILAVVVFGTLAGLETPQMVANQPTPWMGVFERINIFSYMLWIAVLATLLWRTHRTAAQPPESGSTKMSELTGEEVFHLLQKGARDFAGRNLEGISLPRADLSGANLSEADLSGADLSWDNLSRANLSGANLTKADVSKADLREAKLAGANLWGTDLHWSNLSGLDLSGLDLSFANLSGAGLRNVNLSGTDLIKADVSKADLRETKLLGANLHGADLQWSNLSDLDLSGADLSNADLRHANLHHATLTEANLNQARLGGANLAGTSLTGVHL